MKERAMTDIRYLLERGYPRSGAITYVCNHYRLDQDTRHVFTRVVFSRKTAAQRRAKTMDCSQISGNELWIDGYNVLIGVETALSGECVYLCDDGFLRDTRGVFRNYHCTDLTVRAMDAILAALVDCAPARIEFLLDSQISKSGELARWVGKKMENMKVAGSARTSRHVDFDLKHCGGIVATSDGSIIDAVEKVVNLHKIVLERLHIKPVKMGGLIQ